MRQTAKGRTLGCTGSPLKLRTFVTSITAKLTKTSRQSNTWRDRWCGNPRKTNTIVKVWFPIYAMIRFFSNLLAKMMQKNNQCVDSGNILWKKTLSFSKEVSKQWARSPSKWHLIRRKKCSYLDLVRKWSYCFNVILFYWCYEKLAPSSLDFSKLAQDRWYNKWRTPVGL